VEPNGGFILVHVATPLDICEARDRKRLYAKARAGIVQQFTGISDPYEEPDDAEIQVPTTNSTCEEAAMQIIEYLQEQGYWRRLQSTNGASQRALP
jgi:sulfate adenylyltransferase